MSKRDLYQLRHRNLAIRREFDSLLRQGVPTMAAYAQTGETFYLSESRIRDIIANRRVPP